MLLRTKLMMAPALAALLAIAACDQNKTQQQAQNDQSTATSETAPGPVEQAASGAANEIEQASGATSTITQDDLAKGVSASDVANPEATLSTAAVKTMAGESVGEVRSVTVGTDGKAEAVNVEVGGFLNVGERVVAIKADKFTYLKDRNILVAELAKSEVEALPPVQVK